MKNILAFVMLLFCFDVYAAQNQFENNPYLVDAASAWASVLGGGKSGEIATRMNEIRTSDLAAFGEFISVLGFNDSALTLFEISQHTDMAYSVASVPLVSRRRNCAWNVPACYAQNRALVVDGMVSAGTADFDSKHNGDFTTNNTSVSVRAKGYVADGFVFGVGYTRTMTDTKDNKVYTDATSNSITLFLQYLSEDGVFVNTAINGGHTAWDVDKTIASIGDNGAYDTDFYSGQMVGGINFAAGRFTITPQVGARYLRMKTERHVDPAAQSFDKWWYNTLTAQAEIRAGFDFLGPDFVVRPNISLGGGYDIISHGNDEIQVQVASGQTYNIPVEAPKRTAFNGGLGIGVYGSAFAISLDYKMDVRSDYMAHTGMVNLKIAF